MDYGYEITPNVEAERLQVVFADADFAKRVCLDRVQRVGGRRNADGNTTHWVFHPDVEATVRAHIDRVAGWERRAVEDAAAQEAARPDLEAQAAEEAAIAAKKAVAAAARAHAKAALAQVAIDAYTAKMTFAPSVAFGSCILNMPYASGAPELLRAAGGSFSTHEKAWRFPASALDAVKALLPELRVLAARQMIADDKKRNAPARAPGKKEAPVLGIGAAWNMFDHEIIAELGYLPRTEKDMWDKIGTPDY